VYRVTSRFDLASASKWTSALTQASLPPVMGFFFFPPFIFLFLERFVFVVFQRRGWEERSPHREYDEGDDDQCDSANTDANRLQDLTGDFHLWLILTVAGEVVHVVGYGLGLDASPSIQDFIQARYGGMIISRNHAVE
jgi:hypothetical protein